MEMFQEKCCKPYVQPELRKNKSKNFVECFIQMSKPLEDRKGNFGKIQEFDCQMYGFNRLKMINEPRVTLFAKTYKFLDTETFKLPKWVLMALLYHHAD